ncbi:MAG: polyisoprenoid-binding protein [Bacteroidetes bacterium RBG_13_46_8]|nr:MAG: polyisoprenoid-binding protein [Bacteroidetes bacterium RBG_13_46_8]
MKKIIIILFFLGLMPFSQAQKFIAKNGHIWFYSHTPVEEIEAHNRQAVSILDAATGDLQFSLLVKSFDFKIALMQEHFNENYMESDKFPKSSFKGKIVNLNKIDFKKDGEYTAEVSGDLTIHGVTKPVSTTGTMEVKGQVITARAKFVVTPKDYNIEIPSLVEKNIAKSIDVNVDVAYLLNP